jgi:Zn-finger nucleic acid-binding protein
MKQSTIGETTINECLTCRGMWFDRGELEAVKDEVLPEMGWVKIAGLKKQFDFKAELDVLFCPRCRNVALIKIQDQQTNTEFCICTQCKGTWLATGQFLSLINLLLDETNEKTVPELAIISLHQAKELLTNADARITEWHGFKSVLALLKHRIFAESPKLKSLLVGIQKSLPL